MNCKPPIGYHLRLKTNLNDVTELAQQLDVTTYQFFLTSKQLKYRYITPSEHAITDFLTMKNKCNAQVYIHSSYWINPASCKPESFALSKKLLLHELHLAKKLGAKALILHPGSAIGCAPNDAAWKEKGVHHVAHILNELLSHEQDTMILLENTAHGNRAIGSNLHDFTAIKAFLNQPEKVGFCLDIAHAYAYGYPIDQTNHFLTTVDATMGLSNVQLVHLNDSKTGQQSKLDLHEIPGKGAIGKEILKKLIHHAQVARVPKIIESPEQTVEEAKSLLQDVNSW